MTCGATHVSTVLTCVMYTGSGERVLQPRVRVRNQWVRVLRKRSF